MLKERNVPAKLWGEAIRHAVYVLNKLPTRALSKLTPYESWTGKKPHLEYLKVFGCLGYMKLPTVHVKKLDDRSKLVIYLGKEAGTKAFRLYDPVEGTVHVNRDVHFEEKKAWSWYEKQTPVVHTPANFTIIDYQSSTLEGIGDEGESEESSEESLESTPRSSNVHGSSSEYNSGGMSSSPSTLSDSSSEPSRFRSLESIYEETEEIEAADELLLSEIDEPVTYDQAVKAKAWKLAMQNEIDSIESNKTWELTELPPGHKTIERWSSTRPGSWRKAMFKNTE